MRTLLVAAMLVAAPASAAELITNGGFETGDFTGWTVTTGQGTIVNTANPYTGTYAARLRVNNGATRTLSQAVATTQGYSYQLTYWLRNVDATDAVDDWAVTTGATTVDFGDRGAFPYTQFTQNFVGQAGSTLVEFDFQHIRPGAFFLDDVSVTVVPEPTTWALMIAGFAMAGGALRARRAAIA